MELSTINGPCPACGAVDTRTVYDIGSGPELSCASCEWCWGAEGQPLTPVHPPSIACPRCGRVSYHPADIANGYCGRCHDWTGQPRKGPNDAKG